MLIDLYDPINMKSTNILYHLIIYYDKDLILSSDEWI